MSALRRGALVRAADDEDLAVDVHVPLPEGEELTLAKARVDRGREQGPPARIEGPEEEGDLVNAEEVGLSLRNPPLSDVEHGVQPRVPARTPRGVEGASEIAAEMVHHLRRDLAQLLLQEQLHAPGRHGRERQGGQVRPEEVDADRALVRLVRRERPRVGVEPPTEKLGERPAAVLRHPRLDAQPDPLVAPLELRLELPRLGLGPRAAGLAAPASRVVLPPQVPRSALPVR